MCYLYVLLGNKPRSVCEDLVNLVEVAKSLWAELQTFQPIRTHANLLELLHMLTDQRGTLMSRRSLEETINHSYNY